METLSRDNTLEELNCEGKERNGWGRGVGGAIHADTEVNQVESRDGDVKEDDKPGTQVFSG